MTVFFFWTCDVNPKFAYAFIVSRKTHAIAHRSMCATQNSWRVRACGFAQRNAFPRLLFLLRD